MIQEREQLAPHTTLKVGGEAEYFAVVHSEAELVEAITWAKEKDVSVTVLGGGSNILVSETGVSGLVIKNCISGFDSVVNDDVVLVTAGAGEVFDEVVAKTVDAGWWGLENLSHIPGSVGATPVQNVGAYGVEIKDLVISVRVYDTETAEFKTLTADACQFGYRDSLFKKPEGKKYIICSVTFSLSMMPQPRLAYRDLAEYFTDKTPTVSEVREAVILIRSKKFPNWHVVGTAGSFFKNPTVPKDIFDQLAGKYEGLPGFPVGGNMIKIPLAWILDQVLKLKGVRDGVVGTYEGQALVLVNYGDATATDIIQFAQHIVNQVKKETGIEVEWEVTRW